MKTLVLSLAAVIAITLPAVTKTAEAPVAKGEAIARESDRRDLGFGDTKAVLTMILENRKGQTTKRRMRIDTLEVPGDNDGDKSLVIFEHPRDIRGTALLSFAHILEPDDQWLYLPVYESSLESAGPWVGPRSAGRRSAPSRPTPLGCEDRPPAAGDGGAGGRRPSERKPVGGAEDLSERGTRAGGHPHNISAGADHGTN